MAQLSVLCVCLGNTCRSPMMERMLRHAANHIGMDLSVESAGLLEAAREGKPMAGFSIAELERRGIDASGHASRYIGDVDLSKVDILLTVGENEAEQLRRLPEVQANRIIIGVMNDHEGGIPNPYQKDAEAYLMCAIVIQREVAKFLSRL